MKNQSTVCIAFMGVSLGSYMVAPSPGLVAIFIASSLALSFHAWLDRSKVSNLDELKKELTDVKTKLSNVMIQLGWNG